MYYFVVYPESGTKVTTRCKVKDQSGYLPKRIYLKAKMVKWSNLKHIYILIIIRLDNNPPSFVLHRLWFLSSKVFISIHNDFHFLACSVNWGLGFVTFLNWGPLRDFEKSMEMELNKPSDSLQKMQHHPSSSSSAALTASEMVSKFRLRVSSVRQFRRRSPPPPPGEWV